MDRMNHEGMEAKLDALWAEYREACPGPESASSDFMPRLWQKIEARRVETTSIFRHMAQACVMATVALTLLIVVLIPRVQTHVQRQPVYSATYLDVLDAAHATAPADFLTGEIR